MSSYRVAVLAGDGIGKEVMPEANVGDIIYQDMDQTMLIPLLTAALKEAISKIETLESKVSTLESQ